MKIHPALSSLLILLLPMSILALFLEVFSSVVQSENWLARLIVSTVFFHIYYQIIISTYRAICIVWRKSGYDD